MTTDRWRLSHLAREADLTLFTARSRAAVLLFLAVALGVAGVVAAAVETQALHAQLAAQQAAGRNILVFGSLKSQEPVSIDRASCDSLAETPGVIRSGLTQLEGLADFVQLGPDVSVLAASPSLFPGLRDGVLLVGSALHPPTGVDFTLASTDGSLYRARVNGAEPTGLNSNSALVVPLGPDVTATSSCTAVLDQYADATVLLPVLRARLHASGGELVASPVASSTVDPIDVFLDRPGQYLVLALGLLGGVVTGMLTRSRASEIAAYRMSGTAPLSAALLLGLQHALTAGVFATSGAVAVLALAHWLAAPLAVVLGVLAGAAFWCLVALALTADLAVRNVLTLAKDR